MNQGTRIIFWVMTILFLLYRLEAQERSVLLYGTAGAGGLSGEIFPAFAAEAVYRDTNFLDRGHLLIAKTGIGYAGIGYGIPTAAGFFSLQAVGAPLHTEYEKAENGRKITLDMEAPLYRADFGYLIPLENFTLNMTVTVESRPWESTAPATTAPADSVVWDHKIGAEYRGGRHAYSTNPLAPEAGWSLSGGYRNVYRPGFRSWGGGESRFSHDDEPQRQLFLGAAAGIPFGDEDNGSLFRTAVLWKRAFNAYERSRPRYGHPGDPKVMGVSGYVPESLPRDDALLASVSAAASLGDAALATLRFDWLHGSDGTAGDRRGVGLNLSVSPGSGNRIDLSAGFPLDPPAGTDLPLFGSLTWVRSIKIGGK